MKPARRVLLRDGLIFMAKLWLDGLKDVTLSVAALFAIAIDFLRAGQRKPQLFYRVMQFGERIDLWLNLYGAAHMGAQSEEGLFGASRAGDNTFLGKLEELTGGERGAGRPERKEGR